MNKIFRFFIAILPVFLIAFYIYKKDKIKESFRLLFKLFMLGTFTVIPVLFFGTFFQSFFPKMYDMNFFQLFLYTFFAIAFVEEFFKWFFTYKYSYNHIEFDSTYDMIVYAVFVSLGFACFENILYVYEYGITTGILRGLLSVPGHACDGIIMGIYLGLAKVNELDENNNSLKFKLLSIVIPVFTHGIYDLCLFWASPLFLFIFVIFIISLDIICIKKVKSISSNNLIFKYSINFCSECGRKVNNNNCCYCNKKTRIIN